MWECGLKQEVKEEPKQETIVTPYVGVWIETCCLHQRTMMD